MELIFAIVIFIVTLLLGVPVAFGLGLSGLCGVIAKGYTIEMVAQRIFAGMNSFTLLGVPFFMLSAEILLHGGLLKRILKFSDIVVGRLRGGLGHVNVLASMLFSGLSGSAVADAAGLGSIEIPMMKGAGYGSAFSAAITAASSVIGPIIPPSIIMVVYAVVAGNISVEGLFAAGIVPGILMGFSLMAVCSLVAKKRNYPKRTGRFSIRGFFVTLKGTIWAIFMPVIILGGILGGIFTPTEAAAVAVAYAIIVGFFVYRELTFKKLFQAFFNTAILTSTAFLFLGSATLLSWYLTIEQVPQRASYFMLSITQNPIFFLMFVNVLLIFVGMFIANLPALIVLTPILVPIAQRYGIHPLHFGIVLVVNSVLGMITPPVGICLFVVTTVAGDVKVETVSKEVLKFLAAQIFVVLLITYVPSLTLWIPKMLGYY